MACTKKKLAKSWSVGLGCREFYSYLLILYSKELDKTTQAGFSSFQAVYFFTTVAYN